MMARMMESIMASTMESMMASMVVIMVATRTSVPKRNLIFLMNVDAGIRYVSTEKSVVVVNAIMR